MAFSPVISKSREQVIRGTTILLPYYLAANVPEPLFAGRQVPFTGIFYLLLSDKQSCSPADTLRCEGANLVNLWQKLWEGTLRQQEQDSDDRPRG